MSALLVACGAVHFAWCAMFLLDWNHPAGFPRAFVRCYAVVFAVSGVGFVWLGVTR